MQSVEYTVVNHSPLGKDSIENITNMNQTNYWISPEGSSTISINFDPISSFEITILINTISTCIITSKNPPVTIFEGEINQPKFHNKISRSIKWNDKEKISDLDFDISTTTNDRLIIYFIVIKSERDVEEIKTKSFIQASLNVNSFYPKSPSGPKLDITPAKKNNGSSNHKPTPASTGKKNGYRHTEVETDYKEDSWKKYENLQESGQKTLSNYISIQNSTSCSYQNLYANCTKGFIVCCKDEESVQLIVAEICGVLGICYLSELENQVTHVVYSGFDQEIIENCKIIGAVVVDKSWLFHCIEKRVALDPLEYIRKF